MRYKKEFLERVFIEQVVDHMALLQAKSRQDLLSYVVRDLQIAVQKPVAVVVDSLLEKGFKLEDLLYEETLVQAPRIDANTTDVVFRFTVQIYKQKPDPINKCLMCGGDRDTCGHYLGHGAL